MLSRPEDIALVEREAIRIVIRPRCPGVCHLAVHLAVHDTVLHLLEVYAFVAVVLGRDSNVTGEGLATSQCTLGVARASVLVGKFAVQITVFREGCRAYLAVLGCIQKKYSAVPVRVLEAISQGLYLNSDKISPQPPQAWLL